ncbi:hypothetical protein [Halohasta litorea]|uniref:5-methylcytosine-specific restriction enzyme subunit McrC n=1 Tax=Halohasta litorea TaxID=869891 RepID=A0ABD6DA24_9EURY|nr:hypothetical protein [Halohasta litorea]
MNRQELLDHVTDDILAYVMHGAFPEEELARSLKPQQLDNRFEEYELLLDLHFVLLPEVVSFVEQLPKRLRNIRTDTRSVSQVRRGTVDGKINWGSTIKQRYSENPGDTSLFVCENRTSNYDTSENLVLKRLLAVIYNTLHEADEYLKNNYEWVESTWNEQLIDDLTRIVDRNVHVRRIRDPKAYEPTDRMLTAAAESRQALYRDAASILQIRRRLHNGDPEELRRLLDTTAITPDDEDTLFELFVLFRFVATLEDLSEERATFSTIRSGRQEVARIEGDTEVVLYHDSSAADRDLSFLAYPDEESDDLSRTEKVQTTARSVANQYFTDQKFTNHTGRPDLIVLEVNSAESDGREYFITEVKNSSRTDTIRQGIKETLEYLAFLRVDDEFVFDSGSDGSYFGDGANGLLVVQDLQDETVDLDGQSGSEIKILQASELEDKLQQLLVQIVS